MQRRLVLVCVLMLALVATTLAPAGGAQATRSWAEPQIRFVLEHGLMAADRASFRPDDRISQQELYDLLVSLASPTDDSSDDDGTTTPTTDTTSTDTTSTDEEPPPPPGPAPAPPPKPPVNPNASITIAQLDAALVRQLGLPPAATRFRKAFAQAGLAPPARLGNEIVARLLGLRFNHPQAQDRLELLPNQPATRAEVAYSLARALSLSDDERALVDAASSELNLPALDPWQQRILKTATRFVGYPYVWGGTSEFTQTLFGQRVPGGFDCSGYVWRVYKLQRYSGARTLSQTLRGRTTYELSGEVPRTSRIDVDALVPGDVVFFGLRGPKSKPAEVNHMGISLGNGWFINSSSEGVTIAPLSGWWREKFAWGRRPLAEAGLD